MVADFRSLGLGSLSDKQEGEKVSEEEQLRRNQECIKKELAEENGEVYVPTNNVDEAPEIQAQLAVIDALHAKYEAIGSLNDLLVKTACFQEYYKKYETFSSKPLLGEKLCRLNSDPTEADGDATAFAVAIRGENIRLANLRRQYGNGSWSVAQCRPMLQNEVQTMKFTTSFICPKKCLFEQYSIFSP